jgi:hypothetical protein
MKGHFRAPTIGHGPSQRHGQPFHLPCKTFKGGAGRAAVQSALQLLLRMTTRILRDNRAHRQLVEGAVDQASLPVAGNKPRFDVFGAIDNPQRFWDHGWSSQRGAPRSKLRFGLP